MTSHAAAADDPPGTSGPAEQVPPRPGHPILPQPGTMTCSRSLSRARVVPVVEIRSATPATRSRWRRPWPVQGFHAWRSLEGCGIQVPQLHLGKSQRRCCEAGRSCYDPAHGNPPPRSIPSCCGGRSPPASFRRRLGLVPSKIAAAATGSAKWPVSSVTGRCRSGKCRSSIRGRAGCCRAACFPRRRRASSHS